MAHFAKLGLNSKVVSVHVVSNEVATTEQAGIDFLNNLYKTSDVWKQTFKDRSQRKNYAGIGYTYDAERDAFIPPKPFDSWVLNEDTCQYDPPVEYPDYEKRYKWNEETTSWDEVVLPY